MFLLFRHLFIPHASNNHRAKILHHKSLLALALIFVVLSFLTFSLRKTAPSVLGVATNIKVEDLLAFTNQERKQEGLPPLTLNSQLSEAASAKAVNMFAKNYWAHNAPNGITPWVFIQNVGYNYIYAGENLAKDFNDSEEVVNAWMASLSHRENMLSDKYDEIGFAVVDGMLTGSETTLVVEMLGKRASSQVAALPPQITENVTQLPTPTPPKYVPPEQPGNIGSQTFVAGITNKPLIDSAFFTKRISISILAIVIVAFLLDMIYIERRKLIRLVGHNADHILFLVGAIMLILILGRGVVL